MAIIFKIAVLSNAMTSFSLKLAKEISKYADDVVVSLYSHKEEQHDWFMGVKGSLKQKIAGIDNLVANGLCVHTKTLVLKPLIEALNSLLCLLGDKWGKKIHATLKQHTTLVTV